MMTRTVVSVRYSKNVRLSSKISRRDRHLWACNTTPITGDFLEENQTGKQGGSGDGGKDADDDDMRRDGPDEGHRSDRYTYGHVPRKCCEKEEETGRRG